MGILNSVLRAITWWDGQTYGTQLFTSRNGEKVGEDEQGNVYYRNGDDSKRWVIFNGEIEASRIPPDWHGWLHKTFEEAADRPAAGPQGLGEAASGECDGLAGALLQARRLPAPPGPDRAQRLRGLGSGITLAAGRRTATTPDIRATEEPMSESPGEVIAGGATLAVAIGFLVYAAQGARACAASQSGYRPACELPLGPWKASRWERMCAWPGSRSAR